MGVARLTIANYEGGWRTPPVRTLVLLAIALRRKLDWIVTGRSGRQRAK